MATRAIKPKRDNTMLSGWESMPEKPPSVMREDQPTVARVLAMVGVMLVASGLLAQFASNYVVGPGWGAFFLSIGLVLILYHAFVDKDLQFRRVYMGVGLLLTAGGVLLHLLPLGEPSRIGGLFLPYGLYCLTLALLVLLAVLRHEDNATLRHGLLRLIGALGAVMILAGLIVGQFSVDFLTGEGILLLILGLFYVCTFIALQDAGSERGYFAGVALGVAGVFTLVVTLARIFLFSATHAEESGNTYLVPTGLILLGAGITYLIVSLMICSDWPLLVLLRRELGAFFYSPMAYLVLFAMVILSWYQFFLVIQTLVRNQNGVPEPIVRFFIIDIFPVFAQLFVVPILTMRLFSEEKRMGTMEMLLTAPINEATVILAKFFAAWILYMLTWLPMFLFFVSIRALGGDEFDYRPLLSFFFVLAATGAAFVAVGVFFSSLTRNQIIAAVLTFAAMGMFLLCYFLGQTQGIEGTPWGDVFFYGSFIDLWLTSLQGVLAPRYLVFDISVAIFFLFLTDKVLEARKWS